MYKICFKCKVKKSICDFYVHKRLKDGHLNKCKLCTRIDVKKQSSKPVDGFQNYDIYRQRMSIKRMFQHRYTGIVNRSLKLNIKHSYSSLGKKFLSKEEWIAWCYDNKNYKKFLKLREEWVKSNFDHKLAPSIDRINNKIGYVKNNLQWLTKSQNSSKYTKIK